MWTYYMHDPSGHKREQEQEYEGGVVERTNLFSKFAAALKRHPQYDAAMATAIAIALLALHQDPSDVPTRCFEVCTA